MSDVCADALKIARNLVEAGVPVFRARPDMEEGHWNPAGGHGGCGYWLPKGWEQTKPNVRMVDHWRPGEALCAVMGHRVDALDVDPRNGGDNTRAGLQAAGMWPTFYGVQATPSQGVHELIAPLAVGSRDAIRPGLDLKGGKPDGTSRGFIFLAPTRKLSKVTGEIGEYRWLRPPDLEALADTDDDSGQGLADLVATATGPERNSTNEEGDDRDPFDWDRALTPGAVPSGEQQPTLFRAACSLREWGVADRFAHEILRRVVGGFTNAPDREAWTVDHADTMWERVKDKYAPGEKAPVLPALTDPATHLTAQAAPGDAAATSPDPALADVAAVAHKLRIRRAAKRMVDAEERPPAQFPPALTLAERLARPQPPAVWRIDGWQPASSRVVLAAQFKAGKTTVVGNLVRSLTDGAPWLGAATVAPIDGTAAILDTEMGDRQLDAWLADQNIRNADRVVPFPLRGNAAALDLLNPDTRARWAKTLRELSVRYLILDPLRPVLDAIGLDEHREAGRFLVAFDQLLADAAIPDALVVHHMGHTAERSRGDSRIRDWPDVEWRLVREDAEDPNSTRYVAAYGRDVDIGESRLDYDPNTRRLTLAGGSRRDRGVREALEDVLALLHESPRLSGRQIEERVADHPRDPVRRAVKAGVAEGLIVVENGPRRAVLHSAAFSAPQRAASAPAQSSECASALIEKRTALTLADQPSAPTRTGGEWTQLPAPTACADCGRQTWLRDPADDNPRHKTDCTEEVPA